MKDELFKTPYWRESGKNKLQGAFAFDEKVGPIFDDMAKRSIPGYAQNMKMMVEFLIRLLFEEGFDKAFEEKFKKNSQKKIRKNFEERKKQQKIFYDLGCSTGSLLVLLYSRLLSLKNLKSTKLKLIGIDSSQAMIDQALKKENKLKKKSPIEINFLKEDLLKFLPSKNHLADGIFLNYTLQFIKPNLRQKLLKNIYQSLKKGAPFFLSEKVVEKDEKISRLFEEQHLLFKKMQNYSDLEISAKRKSIENFLIPQTLEKYTTQLKKAGFKRITIMNKWYNFASIIAFK